ncbi:MAG: amidohydrolase family protein, partial [Deltaproteobacteria bacterium]|nr:amidohydrolase family protein [Deltaproteobacteria bacterium]
MIETSLGLSLKLVHSGIIDRKGLVRLMSERPARIMGLKGKGTFRTGSDADVTIISPDERWVVDRGRFVSKGKNTPFHGMELRGRATMTITGGTIHGDTRP